MFSSNKKPRVEQPQPLPPIDEGKLLLLLKEQIDHIMEELNFTITSEQVVVKDRSKHPDWYKFEMKYNPNPNKKKFNLIAALSISVNTDVQLIDCETQNEKTKVPYTFHIHEVNTEEPYRGKGYATLLLIYGMSYVKTKWPSIEIFTLDDETSRNNNTQDNIYNKLGFDILDMESKDNCRLDTTKPTGIKKILDLNSQKTPIDFWVNSICLPRINEIQEKAKLPVIASKGGKIKKAKKQRHKKTRKQGNKRSRKHSRKYSRKYSRK